MEELHVKLAALIEKRELLDKENEMYEEKIDANRKDYSKLRDDIWDCYKEIEKLSPVLSDDEKKSLKRDLDYIGKINSVLDIEQCTLRIILEGCHGVKWCASILPGGDHDPITIYDIRIKLWTNSEIIERIVRSCFTQSGCCINKEPGTCIKNCECYSDKDANQEKMARSDWFSGIHASTHPGPCLQRFQYDPEMLDKLLKEV